LSTPKLVRGHFNHTEAVTLFSHVGHVISPSTTTRVRNVV
jgi:hypothetical protein